MAEPTREQLAQDYAKALAIIERLRTTNTELLAALTAICESAGPAGFKHDASASVIATQVIEHARHVLANAEK